MRFQNRPEMEVEVTAEFCGGFIRNPHWIGGLPLTGGPFFFKLGNA
jgi:hypothetical protein